MDPMTKLQIKKAKAKAKKDAMMQGKANIRNRNVTAENLDHSTFLTLRDERIQEIIKSHFEFLEEYGDILLITSGDVRKFTKSIENVLKEMITFKVLMEEGETDLVSLAINKILKESKQSIQYERIMLYVDMLKFSPEQKGTAIAMVDVMVLDYLGSTNSKLTEAQVDIIRDSIRRFKTRTYY